MPPNLKELRWATALALFAAAPLPAQVCAGFAALDETRFRVTAHTASFTYAGAAGASITAGGRALFGTLDVARAYDEEMDAVAYDISIEAGADISDGRRRGFLCPAAALSVSLGPHDFLLFPDTDFRRLSGAIGMGLASVAVRRGRVALHPAASFRVVHLQAWFTAPGGGSDRDQDTYLLTSAGMGLVINDVLTIRPGISIPLGLQPPIAPYDWAVPFGREERELSFDLALGFNFGRRAPR